MSASNVRATDPTDWVLPRGSRPQPSLPAGPALYRQHRRDIVDRFQELLTRWRVETFYASQVQDRIDNPTFRKIVALGRDAIPLIIGEIKMKPDFLVMALHMITRENPVPKSARGKIDEVVVAWLDWAARQKAYAH